MGSPRTKESKAKAEEEAKEGKVVYRCLECGAIGQIKVMEVMACLLCFKPIEPFIGYRRENDG